MSMLLSLEQALPLRPEWLRFSRLRLRIDKPVKLPGPFFLHLKAKVRA